ncbi:helix-turn-helix domain-containing protein [Streptomyces xiaopingdaonensis]|uniref:helix-turn-helix domain-containing protein n=1 Tax=Streptomyces xiaopingdaonensis TaxID=1565415 RepID=UPI000309EE26
MSSMSPSSGALPAPARNGQSQAGPTALRIVLGAQLRRMRQELDITREAAGRAIRGSHAKITRLERGQVGIKERDLSDLLSLYRVLDERSRATYFDLARQANAPGWWHQYSDVLEDWFALHIGLEDAASLIRSYEVQFLPGLLQTEAYAYSLSRLGYPDTPHETVERLVQLRMERQKLLTREGGPRLWVVLDEAVLRRPFGGREVMRDQLRHLLEIADMPHITLQVAPFATGAAAAGAPITILRFNEADLPDKVYLEHWGSAVYLDKQPEIDRYTLIMDTLCAESELPDHSLEMIHRLQQEL